MREEVNVTGFGHHCRGGGATITDSPINLNFTINIRVDGTMDVEEQKKLADGLINSIKYAIGMGSTKVSEKLDQIEMR